MGPTNEEPLLAKDKNEEDLTCGDKVSRQWQSFKVFLYNPAEGTVMGRTGTSWGKNSNILHSRFKWVEEIHIYQL